MKERIYYPLLAVLMVLFCAACNEEWTDEQYERYVSFKAPMNYAKGVTDIYVKYKSNGMVTYQLPLIMSGSILEEQWRYYRQRRRATPADRFPAGVLCAGKGKRHSHYTGYRRQSFHQGRTVFR